MDLKPYDQIAYVPDHVKASLVHFRDEHPDIEFGFVVKVVGEDAFCRYWSKHKNDLRTKANSERTPMRYLYQYKSVPLSAVVDAVKYYDIEMGN